MRHRWIAPLAVLAVAASGCSLRAGNGVALEEVDDGGRDAVVAPPLPVAPEPVPVEPGDGPGGGAEPLPEEPGRGEPGDPGGPKEVEPRGNVVNAHKVDWETARIDREAMTITLTWWSGVEPCTVLDRIEIDYGPDVVTVTVWEGTPEDAAEIACIAIAEQKQATVALEEDIGQRSLADGAEK